MRTRFTPSPPSGEQVDDDRRAAVKLLTIARLLTYASIATLVAVSASLQGPAITVLAVVALGEILATSAWLWRHRPPVGARAITTIVAFDVALWFAACAASGGHESAALILFVVLPSVGAFVLGLRPLIVLAVSVGVARPVLGGDLAELLVFYLLAGWSTAVAIAATRGRDVFTRRLARLDAIWTALSLAGGPSAAIREQVADELRHNVLQPVSAIRTALGSSPAADPPAGLAERMRVTIARTRRIAYELYAPSILHGGIDESLRQLAARRSTEAEITVRIDGEVPSNLAKPLDAVTRELLGLVAGPETREIDVCVAGSETSVTVEVTARPPVEIDAHRHGLRRAALEARPEVELLDIVPIPGGTRVRTRVTGVAAPDPTARRLPAVAFRETRGYVATMRLGLMPVLVGVPLLVGGTDPAYPGVVALVCGYFVATVLAFRLPRSDGAYYLTIACDMALLLVVFALLGDAQSALVPAAIMIPMLYAAMFSWPLILPLSAIAALALPLIGATPQPAFTIAVAWAAALGVLTGRYRAQRAARFYAAAERRSRLLQAMLRAEDTERQRLAERLHDDVLQLLFVARQDLVEASEGSPDGIAQATSTLDAVLDRLTQTVRDLDVGEGAPEVAGGLCHALQKTATERGGPLAVVEVDPDAAGVYDGLLVQLARELYANAAQHGHAETVHMAVSREPDGITLDISDDGVGFDYRRVDDAVTRGCVGLATVRDRTTWSGGTVELGPAAGGGARVRVSLPWGIRTAAHP